MKPRILKLCTVFLLFAFLSAGCQKDEELEYSEPVKGYIVGAFKGVKINAETGESLGINTEMGYCILLEGSKGADDQYEIDFYTFNMPSGLFSFPKEILSSSYDNYTCGPVFFPDSLRFKYPMTFQYETKSVEEKIQFGFDGPCFSFLQLFPWQNFEQVMLKEVTLINN